MAKRLSAKHKNQARDKATAYAASKKRDSHKIGIARSKKALKKKAYPMT